MNKTLVHQTFSFSRPLSLLALAVVSIIVCLHPTASLAATITYVQSADADPQTPATSVPVTFAAAQGAGDLNVVVVGWNDSTASVSSVIDKSGNTYALAVGPTVQSGVGSQSTYYAKNIVAAAAGVNVVTVTFSAAAVFPDIRILEYKGADASNPVDVTAASTGDSATSSSGAATTTNATDLIFGANLVQTRTTGAATGFTSRVLSSPDGDIAEDEAVTAVGSYTATAPITSGEWIMQMVAFRTPSGSGPAPTVTSVAPNAGSTGGGTAVTITGTNFAAGATVMFGNNPATNVVVASATSITAATPTGSLGAVAVAVTVAGQTGSLASGFTYVAVPTVTSAAPNTGSTGGGTSVTITGTNFATGATVTFGGTAATSVVVVSSTSITAKTPAGNIGSVTVTVTNTGALSGSLANGFTYAVVPAVTSLSPNSGPAAGGTAVTITGSNFASGATVTFGGTPAINVAVVSSTSITATTPAGSAGAVTVMVTVSGQSGSLANGFTYIGVPTVSSVSPNSGPTAGGTAVTIAGANFATGATVTFGGTAATNVVVVSSTSITATTPAGTGSVTVTATNPGSQSGSLSSGFTYGASTTITFVQGNDAVPQTSPTSVPVTFTTAQAAGDLNVVVVGWNNSTATVSTVTDKSGNVYTRVVGPTIQTGVASQSIYYAKNIVAAAAGVNIVTVTFSAAAVSPDIRILEYKGADPTNPVDVTAAASGTGTSSNSGAVTTTNATDLIFGANLVQTGTTAAGTGFTSRLLTSPDGDIAEDEMVTAIGSYSATATLQSGQWIMQLVAFRTTSPGPPAPTVTSVSPNSGLAAGGTSVTITGTNFVSEATVTFGGTPATSVVVVSGTSITAKTPAGTAGVVTVTVMSNGQNGSLTNGFTYIGIPTVTSVSPNSGSTAGGNAVTITGTNFATGATVTFGATPATNVVVLSTTSITATTPAGSVGAVTVTVTNTGSQSGSLASAFTYAVLPAVTSVTPNNGPVAGGTAVTITGGNFVAGATVTFGGASATNVVVVSSTSITATTPAGTAGAVTVTVTVSGQSGSLASGFAYIAPPTVTSISPNSGSTVGGTAVTIGGTNFATGSTVKIGASAATNVVVVSSTSITATTPSGVSGAVTVTVTNPLAQSGSLTNGFTYADATTITYVQSAGSDPQTAMASVPVTFATAQAAGDLNVVVVGWNDSTATVGTVTDKSGNTYTRAVGPTVQTGVASQSIYYAKNIVAAAAGVNIVTVTFSTAAAFPDIRILEYKGADPNNPLDVTAAATGTSAAASSGAATTTSATDLIFGANLVQTLTTGAGTGFTSRLLSTPDGDIAEDEMVTAVGSYSATAPLSSGQWIIQMVAFRTTDTTPPIAPTKLTSMAISSSQINLSWAASTDNIGVTGYLVEHCQGANCSNFAQIGTSPTITFSDTGLVPNTSYSYRVRATDADNNLSQYSNIATVSTLLPTPTAPSIVSLMDGGPGPVVQTAEDYINASFLTTHTTAPLDTSGGDLIVLAASAHSGVTFTPSDSFGNTWIPITGPTNASATKFDLRTQLWFAPHAIVGPLHTITMNLSTMEPLVMSVIVLRDSNISSPIDVVSLINSDNLSGSASVASPNITTSFNNDLLIGFAKVSNNANFTAGPGFTLQTGSSSNFLAAETAPAPTVGSYQATFMLNPGQDWESAIVAAANNPNQTTLSWTGSTEIGGTIAKYLVERCQSLGCLNFAQIATTTGTSFNDIGLTGGISYSYRVRAEDTANMTGPYSSVVTIATPTPIPSTPSAPENLTAAGLTFVAAQSLTDGLLTTSHTTAAFNSSGGDLIVLAASSLAGVNFTPTDSFGNTYLPLAAPTSTTIGSDLRTQLWYVQNPTVGSGHTVTIGLSSGEPLVASVVVVKGSYLASPIDIASMIGSDNGTQSTTVQSPSITTTSFNDLLIGFGKVSNGADFLSGPTFTEPASSSSNFLYVETANAPTPGTYAATFSIDSTQTWQSAVVAAASNPNQITLSWTPSVELGGTGVVASISNYSVERCLTGAGCTFAQIGTTTSTTFNDTGLAGSTGYSYRVRGEDSANTFGPYSPVVTLTTPVPLTPPQNLTATPASSTEIDLAWTASAETGGTVSSYNVQRCLANPGINSTGQPCSAGFITIMSVPAALTTYSDTGLTGGIFNYRVQAVDSANNVSLFSNVATASIPDSAAPSMPANLQAVASLIASQISLSWGASTDNIGVTGYLVERCLGPGCTNFAQAGTSTTTSYTDTGLAPGTTYTYCVSATDAAGNVSLCSSPSVMATTPNLGGPGATGTPTANLGGPGPSVVAVQNVEDGALPSHTSAPFDSTGGNLILLYAYTIPGVTLTPSDTLHNTWIPVAGPTTTTLGGDLLTELWYAWNPNVGQGHTITITLSSSEPLLMSVLVVQNANVSSPIDAVSLIGSGNGLSIVSPSIATIAANDLLTGFAATSASVTFTPTNGFTLQAGASNNVLAAETAPAATPGAYSAMFTLNASEVWQSAIAAAADNPNQATVSWSPASGNVLNYLVWRCATSLCSNFALVGTVPAPSTTFNDIGLAASTSYTYQVQAEDTTFTVGPFSGTTTVVTPPPTPSLPGNLTVTTSGTTNTLSWIASQELGGTVSSYMVQSCQGAGCTLFVTISNPNVVGTTYSDLNVTPGTSYTYRVQGVDGNNVASPFSNVATVVTPAP